MSVQILPPLLERPRKRGLSHESPFRNAVDCLHSRGGLAEQAVDDHQCNHYTSGTELVDDFACKETEDL